jgi:hypothetical protein
MGSVQSVQEVGRYEVAGRTIVVERTTWTNDPGLSFDLYLVETGDQGEVLTCLTDESFDEYPSRERMREYLDYYLGTGPEPGPPNLPNTERFSGCHFCGRNTPPMRIIGMAGPDENPWCCDGCWDERLR